MPIAKETEIARDILESYSNAEFFTKLPDIDEEIKVVSFVAAEGDISTDLLSLEIRRILVQTENSTENA